MNPTNNTTNIQNKQREARLKKCAAYQKRYRDANKDKVSASNKTYREANRDKCNLLQKQWYDVNQKRIIVYRKAKYAANQEKEKAESRRRYHNNKEQAAAKNKRWLANNYERARNYRQRRRSLLAALPATLIEAEWQEILALNFHRCHYCGKKSDKLTQDHVIPVTKGGHYKKDNIVPACKSCNSSKGVKNYRKFVKQNNDRLQMELF